MRLLLLTVLVPVALSAVSCGTPASMTIFSPGEDAEIEEIGAVLGDKEEAVLQLKMQFTLSPPQMWYEGRKVENEGYRLGVPGKDWRKTVKIDPPEPRPDTGPQHTSVLLVGELLKEPPSPRYDIRTDQLTLTWGSLETRIWEVDSERGAATGVDHYDERLVKLLDVFGTAVVNAQACSWDVVNDQIFREEVAWDDVRQIAYRQAAEGSIEIAIHDQPFSDARAGTLDPDSCREQALFRARLQTEHPHALRDCLAALRVLCPNLTRGE